MKANKEIVAGILFILLIALVIWLVGGQRGLVRVGIMVLIAWITLYLLRRKTNLSKKGAVILNPDLLVKFLMPRKYQEAIKELEQTEKKG